MNNYCTNCGNKLKTNDLMCEKCKTPIVNIPSEYKYTSNESKKIKKIILKILCIITILIALFFLIKHILFIIKINNLKKAHVLPYIQQNYNAGDYDIKYSSSGKCVLAEVCLSDEDKECEEYSYYNKDECISYHYNVKNKNNNFTITLDKIDDKFFVYEGNSLHKKVNQKELLHKYVEPFVLDNYGYDYVISYFKTSRCVIDGNCSFDPALGCDGGACDEYEYLDGNECVSYYYQVKSISEEFIVTVFEKNGIFSVVKGTNINGKQEEIDEDSDNEIEENQNKIIDKEYSLEDDSKIEVNNE